MPLDSAFLSEQGDEHGGIVEKFGVTFKVSSPLDRLYLGDEFPGTRLWPLDCIAPRR